MGLWQNLVDGYDRNPELARVDVGGMFPLSSTTISNQTDPIVVISLNADGSFMDKEMIPKRNNKNNIPRMDFPIPVTQESLNRTRESYPNPIFDQREYVFPSMENGRQSVSEKNKKYRKLLQEFAESPLAPLSVKAVFRYISDTVRDFDADLPNNTKSKTFILFRVFIKGQPNVDLWKSTELFQAWHSFYLQKVKENSLTKLDTMTGMFAPVATFHPKKVFASSGNAKLISSNDDKNYTFRGRFVDASQTVSIGYESSQKAHQFLRYLISNNGIICGEQVIVPFTCKSGPDSLPPPPVTDEDEFWDEEETKTTADCMTTLGANTGIDYAKVVSLALNGQHQSTLWFSHAPADIAILEAATTGRLSVTYYHELRRHNYLEKVQQWHEQCKWPLWLKDKKTEKYHLVFGAPSFERILQAAFGWSKPGKDESYERIKKRVRAQLIRSVFDNSPIPADYIVNAICRVSNPLAISSNGKFDRARFLSALSTTCALLKHQYYNTKEAFDMSIDLKRTDRDYLYGRLLGAADQLEKYALYNKAKMRPTAAIRYMLSFSQHPFTSWQIIHDALLPYKQQVSGSIEDVELQSIHDMFTPSAFEDDRPLSGLYLIGYYHEYAYIKALNKSNNNN